MYCIGFNSNEWPLLNITLFLKDYEFDIWIMSILTLYIFG